LNQFALSLPGGPERAKLGQDEVAGDAGSALPICSYRIFTTETQKFAVLATG
jgi:hypothetical protein